MSRYTAHGAQVVKPPDYTGRARAELSSELSLNTAALYAVVAEFTEFTDFTDASMPPKTMLA